ncbi:Rv1733c family protein (plasmid) [Rhodococcus qingshengii]
MRDHARREVSPLRRLWRCAPWSANSLMRTSDRFLAALAIAAVVVALLAIPLSATVGTSVYASDRARSEQQENTYDRWSGTVMTWSTASSPANPAIKEVGTTPKVVTWTMNGTERTEPLVDHFSARPGETITVWTNSDGEQVRAPMDASLAAVDGIAAAVLLCCAMIFGFYLAAKTAGTWIAYRNLHTWEKEWHDIVEHHL